MPLSRSSASLPKVRTKPFGTTVLYSNQKSKRSPRRKITSASCLMLSSHFTKIFSRGKLSACVGAPRWLSLEKYIFLPCGICIFKDRKLFRFNYLQQTTLHSCYRFPVAVRSEALYF